MRNKGSTTLLIVGARCRFVSGRGFSRAKKFLRLLGFGLCPQRLKPMFWLVSAARLEVVP